MKVKRKLSTKETEKVAGGSESKTLINCSTCGCEFTMKEFEKYRCDECVKKSKSCCKETDIKRVLCNECGFFSYPNATSLYCLECGSKKVKASPEEAYIERKC